MNRARTACMAAIWAATLCGCTADIGIDDFKYACAKNNDCGEGYSCEANWCVRLPGKGDGGTTDAGIQRDAGADAGDAGTISDAGFVIRYMSTFDSSAGTGASTGYKLKVVTGWSVGPRWSLGDYALKPGQPFEKGNGE
ncbi:MAG: hypothetical protein HY897_24470 [Deltaproteobacteria bacterium]|nr:hypothetical protein [Deltaproteobacteria bacterium]